jgi:hypothetical protein
LGIRVVCMHCKAQGLEILDSYSPYIAHHLHRTYGDECPHALQSLKFDDLVGVRALAHGRKVLPPHREIVSRTAH